MSEVGVHGVVCDYVRVTIYDLRVSIRVGTKWVGCSIEFSGGAIGV